MTQPFLSSLSLYLLLHTLFVTPTAMLCWILAIPIPPILSSPLVSSCLLLLLSPSICYCLPNHGQDTSQPTLIAHIKGVINSVDENGLFPGFYVMFIFIVYFILFCLWIEDSLVE